MVPQALRVILPPLTNQYLNLTKNSSLAVAIGYPDLVSVFAGTTLSQTGQAIEIIAITMGVYLLISLVTSAIMSFYGWRLGRSWAHERYFRFPPFVRQELVPERAAPVKTTGFVGFLRTRLFNSPTNILLTIVGVLLLWFTVVPAVKFLLIDAVWTGKDRNACLAENAGHTVGACWPFIQAKFSQFIYGFYPEAERWRVNLTFFLAALLLLPLLIPRLPAKGLNAGLFFVAFPVVAFFLLHGGGLKGFGVSWTAGLLSGFNDSIGEGGRKLVASGETTAVIGPLLWLLGKLLVLLSTADFLVDLAADLASRPDSGLRPARYGPISPPPPRSSRCCCSCSTAAVAPDGGPLVDSLAIFAGIGIVIAVMGLDRGGLAGGRYPAVGRASGDAGGVGHRHRRLDAGRHRAGAGPALDDSADPDFFDRLHRVLARRAADHGAVLRNLHAAAVRSGRFHDRRSGARPDRHRAVCRRLSGRSDPRRPAGDPARAGRGGERARPVLGEDHRR